MSDKLIDKLTSLNLEKKYLKRQLDILFYDPQKKKIIFNKIRKIDKEIEYIKFKLNLERKLKDNGKNISD